MSLQTNGSNLSEIFQPRTSTKRANVNLQEASIDISNIYEPLRNDQRLPNLSLLSNSSDISALFMGNDSQYINTVKGSSTRTSGWNTSVTYQFRTTWSSQTAYDSFFLYGGRIKVSASFSPSVSNSKNNSWQTLLNDVGSVEVGRTNSYRNNNESVISTIGAIDLSVGQVATLRTINDTSPYSGTFARVRVQRTATNQIIIFYELFDNASEIVDELVTGTLVATATERRHPSQSSTTYATLSNF